MAREEGVLLPLPAWSLCSWVHPAPTPCPLTARCTNSRPTQSVWTGIQVTWSTSEMPDGASNVAPGPAVTGLHPMMEKTLPQTQSPTLLLHLPPTPPWLCFLSTFLFSREETVTLLQASRGRPLWLLHDPSGAAQSGTVESGMLPLAKTTVSASHHVQRNAACRERSSSKSLCLIAPLPPHLQSTL